MKTVLCPDCPATRRSRKTEPPEGFTRVTKGGSVFEVVVTMTVRAASPDEAADIASGMVGITHHISVYAGRDTQEREVLSKRVRRK